MTGEKKKGFETIRFLAISDSSSFGAPAESLLSLIEDAPAGSLGVILREKSLSAEERRPLARALLKPIRRHEQFLIISDDLDLVLELDADGLHCSRSVSDLASIKSRLGDKWLSQGASLNPSSALSARDQAQNQYLTARLISPVWQERKQCPPIGNQRFADFLDSHHKEIESLPLIYALGGATPSLIDEAAAEHPHVTWRAAAIGSAHDRTHQAKWVSWLKNSG